MGHCLWTRKAQKCPEAIARVSSRLHADQSSEERRQGTQGGSAVRQRIWASRRCRWWPPKSGEWNSSGKIGFGILHATPCFTTTITDHKDFARSYADLELCGTIMALIRLHVQLGSHVDLWNDVPKHWNRAIQPSHLPLSPNDPTDPFTSPPPSIT
ncbi:hypothetical protein L596_009274 [Steinernema carpocapsae]|uniref:Uncharacterized protein n=1 Tax=Steinernema carpocapsae TaxID=34508 RepID=A0A4V6A6I5_STECR|nr:hypothetical protein L596_009274 [Steinernema carpocapsae]